MGDKYDYILNIFSKDATTQKHGRLGCLASVIKYQRPLNHFLTKHEFPPTQNWAKSYYILPT